METSRPSRVRALAALGNFAFLAAAFLAATPLRAQTSAPSPVISAEVVGNELAVAYEIPAGYHMLLQPAFLTVGVRPVPGLRVGPVAYPPTAARGADGAPKYSGRIVLTRALLPDRPIAAGTVLQVSAGWQLCAASGACLLPGSVTREVAAPALDPPPRQRPLPYFLLLAFLGGLILNLMPCVLPVLSIKLLSLATPSHRSPGAFRRGAVAYTLGVLLSFAGLAAIVTALRAGGEAIGWGFQFQNPGFVMGLLVTIWLFALSLFDLFQIRAPGMQLAADVGARNGWTGAFLSGVFAVLLATPCTAPLLGAAMGFAFVQPAWLVFLLFLLVGLGLAFPFLLVGFLPRAASWIPKPGAWMTPFREIMGFLLLATAVWLIGVLDRQLGGRIQGVLAYLLVLSVAAWIYGRFANAGQSLRRQWLYTGLAATVAVGGWFAWVDLHPSAGPSSAPGGTSSRNAAWEPFSPERVERLRAEGRPVFIDFTAEWCLTCKINKRGVLDTDAIQAAFRQHNVALLRGDFTRADPVIAEWLRRYRRAGVPLYLFFAPGRAEPVILPELITRQMILDLLTPEAR
jgi:thiol:disulfide interchange protein DsbD